jgi:hypothetical protein
VLKILYNKLDGISFVFLKPQPKKVVEEHHEKYGVNVIGLPKFRLPLEEADALKKAI